MTDGKRTVERLDLSKVLTSYSRRLLLEFEESASALALPFDRGGPRENAVRKFLMGRLSGRYGVGEGIVIDGAGGQSKQCDVVIYDRERCPDLRTENALSFWLYEFVYAAAEVKSILTKAELKKAVNNIAAFKRLSRPVNDSIGRGVKILVGQVNRPVGMLIAHRLASDVDPSTDEFDRVINSVPPEYGIDAFCIIDGWVGFRGHNETSGASRIDLESPNHLIRNYGEGALAAFLIICKEILGGIDLGEPHLLDYLRFLESPRTK
jgi:hypothetical protein